MRFLRQQRRQVRPARRVGLERLEPRLCLAAATQRIEWLGQAVDARADSWIVRSERPLAAADLISGLGWRAMPLGEGLERVVAPGSPAKEVLAWAGRTPGVAFVEPDFAITGAAVPNDRSFGSLWALDNTGQSGGVVDADIDAPEAWTITTGSRGVVVAVIDSGIDYQHPDLAANVWANPGEIAGDGVDNDRNGFVDDVHGWDFANSDADPMDDDGHGTHVAGTIGAVGNNGTGVVGVNWQVSIMGLKFLDAAGSGYTSDAIAAINYATRMRRDFGINVVATNNSWGGRTASAALRTAIDAGGAAGILFVTAAGNDAANNDTIPSFPATITSDAIISVAATDRSNRLAAFSNFGRTTVDLAAPGVGLVSTVPRNAYESYSGTSMAAPLVTGTVALLAAARPGATAAELRAAILSSTTPVAALAGTTASGGLLNARAALEALGATTPTPPPAATSPPPEPPPPPAATRVKGDAGDVPARSVVVPARGSGTVAFASRIGDGSFGRRDVDLYRVTLAAGQRITIDVRARALPAPSPLDSALRLFTVAGRQLVANDDALGIRDSFITFTATTAGTYYVGVSGAGNTAYNPRRGGSGRAGSTGRYEISLRFDAVPVTRRAGGLHTLGSPDAAAVMGDAFAAVSGTRQAPYGHGRVIP